MITDVKKAKTGWVGSYVLEGKTPTPCYDIIVWGKWMEKSRKEKSLCVAFNIRSGYKLSTVFLGLDHGFFGTPLLFETMIFSPKTKSFNLGKKTINSHIELGQWRYSTWEKAEKGHAEQLRILETQIRKANRKYLN